MLVKVRCPSCDTQQQVLPSGITLCEYDSGPRYGFKCEVCDAHCSVPADGATLSLLKQAGITRRIPIPRPTIDGQPPDGPPLDRGDWLDLIIDLHRTGDGDLTAELA